jgi:hypothetical protein
MAEDRKGGRSGGQRQSSARSAQGGPRGGGQGGKTGGRSGGVPQRGTGKPARSGGAGGTSRGAGSTGGKPRSGGAAGGKPRTAAGSQSRTSGSGGGRFAGKPSGKPSGKPAGARYGAERSNRRPVEREPEPRTADQAAYDGPDLPDHITGKELDRAVAAQLKGLPEKLAARVARHLAAAGYYIDEDPELAYQHAKAAKARTQRLAVIREALGEAAYAAGHYAEALAELRAAKRMNGATAYLPIMADCHRALGHPEQAIKLAHSPSVVNFRPEAKAEMTLVESGARRDMGQLDAALRILELAPLSNKSRASWVVRLRYAYADTLEAAGRLNDALTWFHRTHAIDSEDLTDAATRAADLERRVGD